MSGTTAKKLIDAASNTFYVHYQVHSDGYEKEVEVESTENVLHYHLIIPSTKVAWSRFVKQFDQTFDLVKVTNTSHWEERFYRSQCDLDILLCVDHQRKSIRAKLTVPLSVRSLGQFIETQYSPIGIDFAKQFWQLTQAALVDRDLEEI